MRTMTLGAVLADSPAFRDLSGTAREELSGCARNVRFAPGTSILREGEPAERFYVLRHGRVSLSTVAPGRGAVLIETLGPGEVLGWSWILPPYRWHFDVEALEPVGAVEFDAVCLRSRFEENPVLGYELMRSFLGVVVHRLQATRLRLLDLYAP